MMMSDFFCCFLHLPSSRKLSSRVELLCFQLDAGWEGVCNHEYGSYVSCTAAGIEVLSTRLGVIWQCVKICFWGLRGEETLVLHVTARIWVLFWHACCQWDLFFTACIQMHMHMLIHAYAFVGDGFRFLGLDLITLNCTLHGSLGFWKEGRRNEYLFCEHCVLGIILLPVGFY